MPWAPSRALEAANAPSSRSEGRSQRKRSGDSNCGAWAPRGHCFPGHVRGGHGNLHSFLHTRSRVGPRPRSLFSPQCVSEGGCRPCSAGTGRRLFCHKILPFARRWCSGKPQGPTHQAVPDLSPHLNVCSEFPAPDPFETDSRSLPAFCHCAWYSA